MIRAARHFGFLGLALLVSSGANAAVEPTAVSKMSLPASVSNIHSGNLNVGGYFDFTKSSGRRNDDAAFSANVNAKYFLIDHLALGLGAGLDADPGEDAVASIGPTASYFFWNDGKLAAHVDLGFRIGLTDRTVPSFLQSAVGLDYFVAPTVALGPSLFLNHYNDYRGYQRFGVSFHLGVYL